MTYASFERVILLLKQQSSKTNTLYKNGVDTFEYTDPYHQIIKELFIGIYGKDGEDMVSFFCYECEFGKGLNEEHSRAWDKDSRPICYDIKSLYEWLESTKQENK